MTDNMNHTGITSSYDVDTASTRVRLPDEVFIRELPQEIVRCIASSIAEEWVKQNFSKVAALIDPQAVANLSIAEAASRIRETLSAKLPDKIMEVHTSETQVFQQGLLGGLKRIR